MANELPINAGGMKVDYDEPTTISTSFFGGPWDGESHWVPYPLLSPLVVPVLEPELLDFGGNLSLPKMIATAAYILRCDEDGHYYVCDNYGQ